MRFVAMLLVCACPAIAQVAPTPFTRAKVRLLLRDQLPCLGCHEFDGEGGRIGPSLTDISRRRDAAYIRAMIEAPQRVAPHAAMPLTPMPRARRDAVIQVLAAGAVAGTPPDGSARSATRLAPEELYAKWCASCHGATGNGDGANARYLPVPPAAHSSRAAMSARSDAALFDVIAAGGPAMGKSARMPAFGATLSSTEIRQLVAYIRRLCDCQAPGWSRDPAAP